MIQTLVHKREREREGLLMTSLFVYHLAEEWETIVSAQLWEMQGPVSALKQ